MTGTLFAQVLQIVFAPQTLLYLIIGVTVGIIAGALPGISASMGVALCLPLTYGMDAAQAIITLTAIYTGAIYGGGITATLCSTPGTSSAAATAIDGYQLTLKGRGQEAIGLVTFASSIGGMMGALVLLLLAPPIGRFSLQFIAPEYFMLTLFALVLVAPLSGDSLAKGLFISALGLLIGTVGLDNIQGVNRFTFHILQLEDGISVVPALIGTFSVSQILLLTDDVKRGKNSILEDPSKGLVGRILPPWSVLKTLPGPMLRSGILGLFTGIIPAAGAAIASWVGYTVGKMRSKHPEEFGKGSFEAVACAETANNACCGGALIPMFTLGIPGSGATAILMGGMMIHGLIPGGELFTKQAVASYSIFLGFFLANLMLMIIGLSCSRFFAKISIVPTSFLCPLIFCLAMIGSYAIRNSMVDIVIMILFGAFGLIIKKLGFPTAPLVLGLVLSEIAEKNYRRALVLARGAPLRYYLSRPICVILFILIIGSLFLPILVKFLNKRMKNELAK
jgi:putative tricarboxylic transport membrane protein